jgi:peptidoglycan hydrolase CwlO-like protein
VRAIVLSALCSVYLFGANDPQGIVTEVAKLRQKYEECRQEQTTNSNDKIKGYQTRITNLENQIKQSNNEFQRFKKENTELERELFQKRGVIQSLEKTLTSKDQKYRDVLALNERFTKETNADKVSKIERENLKRALIKAKIELEQLGKSMGKTDKEVIDLRVSLSNAKAEIEKLRTHPNQVQANTKAPVNTVPVSDQSAKIKALQSELAKANSVIVQMQKVPASVVLQEKIVTKVVEPTEKIVALQRELSSAQATIANLKKSSKVITQEKIVEKIVYKDRPVIHEKIVEKVLYKERPVMQEKTATKTLTPTEHLNKELTHKLAQTPKLTPPPAIKNAVVSTTTKIQHVSKGAKSSVTVASETPKKSAPSAYRMSTNASVYNAPGGSMVDTWEARRSFTSGTASNGWIKITGYFVNRVWTRADEELWVKESDVIRR